MYAEGIIHASLVLDIASESASSTNRSPGTYGTRARVRVVSTRRCISRTTALLAEVGRNERCSAHAAAGDVEVELAIDTTERDSYALNLLAARPYTTRSLTENDSTGTGGGRV